MLSLTPKQILYLGFLGTFLNAVSQIPEVVLTFSEKDLEAVSIPTNILIFLSQLVWLLYGYYIHSTPMIFSSIAVAILCFTIVVRVLYVRKTTS